MQESEPINNSPQCPICLEALLLNTEKTTTCSHKFCTSCLDKWLAENHTCPMCRTELNDPDVKKNNFDSHHIYTIPWAIRPVDTMPSGSMNYSRIDTIPPLRLEFRN